MNPVENHTWAAARTAPSSELKASEHLERRDYSIYLPMLRERIGRTVRTTALFPRYLFVLVTSDPPIGGVNRTPYVESLVKLAGQPAMVGSEIIETIRSREAPDGCVWLDDYQQSDGFGVGQLVRVLSGPLAGFSGVYRGSAGGDREAVLMALLGRSVRANIPTKNLIKV